MSGKRCCTGIGVVLAVCALPAARAQYAEGPTVGGIGSVTIELPAQLLRMQIDLSAKHKVAAEALSKLKTIKEAAARKLEELGAIKESARFTDPVLNLAGAAGDAEMQHMVWMRTRGKQPDESKLKAMPITASVHLTAEWPLKGETPEERLLAAHELREKITAAELAGAKEPLTPEEEEMQDEMENSGGSSAPQAGTPSFVFVAKISEEDQDKALAEAFDKARKHAERVAKAAGMPLGKIHGLSGSLAPAETEYPDELFRYVSSVIGQAALGTGAEGGEAVGQQPIKVRYHVTVNATFSLGAP